MSRFDIAMAPAVSRGGVIMDYADRLDMMDDDCDIQGYPLNDDRCAGCPLDGHCEFVKCKEKEGMQNVLDKQDKG